MKYEKIEKYLFNQLNTSLTSQYGSHWLLEHEKHELVEMVDNYADSYVSDIREVINFLAKISSIELMDLINILIVRYDDNNLIVDWLSDKIELVNEIVGYLLRDYLKLN